MSKSRLLSVFFFFVLSLNSAQQKSKISSVVVFLEGAEVSRTAEINLKKGENILKFNALSPYIIERSIQVSGLAEATILSITFKVDYLSKQVVSDSISFLENQIKSLEKEYHKETHKIAGYREELELIKRNRLLSNDNETLTLERIKAFSKYYRERTTELKSVLQISEENQKSQTDEIAAIKKQLGVYQNRSKTETGFIVLKLDSETNTKINLKLKYLIKEAGWFPLYDIKATDINTPLKFDYKAQVYQNTGVEWNNVKLTLSTSDPTLNNQKPEVLPKYLNFISRNYKRNNRSTKAYNYKYNPMVKTVSGTVYDNSGIPLPGVSVIVKGTSRGVQTDFDGNYSIDVYGKRELSYSYIGFLTTTLPVYANTMNLTLEEDATVLDEVVVTGYAIRGRSSGVNLNTEIKPEEEVITEIQIEDEMISTQFKIKKRYTIVSDGDVSTIQIDRFLIPATFEYFTAPILNENVFLTAKIDDWQNYNLLPAEAHIYFNGSYSGKSFINPLTTDESLNLSLGVDPNISVKRTQINDFKKKRTLGTNRLVYKGFEIEIQNNKKIPVEVSIFDRIPISQNRDIKIDNIEFESAEYNKNKGILKWKSKLVSKQKQKLKLSYSVKFPKNKRINL